MLLHSFDFINFRIELRYLNLGPRLTSLRWGLLYPDGTVIGWDFRLRIELSVVPFRASTFHLQLVKNMKKVPNSRQNRPVIHLIHCWTLIVLLSRSK